MKNFLLGLMSGLMVAMLIGASSSDMRQVNSELRDTNRHLRSISQSLNNIQKPFGSWGLKIQK